MPDNIDKDTRVELEQVKKGKSRRFVMLTKGASIVSLVVYKKGSVETYKKEAKEAGTGQLCYGIVTGPGPDIVFQLAAADGFDKQPVKGLVLKQFLEEAGFKFKPDIHLVAEHEPVLDEDDALVKRYFKLRDAATLVAKAQPDREAELKGACGEIVQLLDKDQDDAAKGKLDALEAALGKLSTGSPSNSNGSPPTPPPTPPQSTGPTGGNEMQIFSARLKAIKPDLDDLIAGGTKEGAEAKDIAGDLPEIVKSKDFVKGNAALDKIDALLDAATPGRIPGPPLPPNSKPVTSPDRKLAAALRSLGPALSQALKAYPDRKAEIDKLRAAVDLCIKSGKFDEGEQLIDRLDDLLKTLGSVAPEKAAEFREPWRLAKEVWDGAVADVRDQMNELQNLLVSVENDDDLLQIGEMGLNAVTQSHLVPIRAALMEIDASGADRLKTSAKKLQNLLGEFRKHIETSPKVQACEDNPFGVAVSIRQTLEPGFDALENGLNFITAG